MSVVFTMTALAVASAISAVSAGASIGAFVKDKRMGANSGEPMVLQTRFQDKETLKKTLTEHGFSIHEENNGDIILTTTAGKLRYFMDEETGVYMMQCFDVPSDEELEAHCDEIEAEYMNNVQKSTYLLLKERIGQQEDMDLASEEFMEDGTVLLTINV